MKRLTCIFSLMCLLSSCVHEFPYLEDASVGVNIDFDVNVDLGLELDMPIYMEDLFLGKSNAAQEYEYNLRYIIKAFPQKKNGDFYTKPSNTWIFTKDEWDEMDHKFQVKLPEGVYKFMCWTDYTHEDPTHNHFFSPDENFLVIKENTEHIGNNRMRKCWRGSTVIDVVRRGSNIEPVAGVVEMEMAIARYSVEAIDLDDFKLKAAAFKMEQTGKKVSPEDIDIEDYIAVFYYTGFKPNAYNLHTDRPCDSNTGYRFKSQIVKIEDDDDDPKNDKAFLGFDYCFANGTETTVNLAIGIEDKDGNEISLVKGINLRLQRGKQTIMRGRFMTQESYGGVSINPDFDGEFNIII